MRYSSRLTYGFAVWLTAAALGVPLALADPPAAEPPPAAAASRQTPIPQALGVAEGALAYCSPIDPSAAAGLRQLIGQMTQGASERQLAEVRNSDEYRKAYDSVLDFTSKIDGPRNARRFCSRRGRWPPLG